jgi:GH43 family beta-xylosidase
MSDLKMRLCKHLVSTFNGANSKNVWAPEHAFFNNKWYVYYAADDGTMQTTECMC